MRRSGFLAVTLFCGLLSGVGSLSAQTAVTGELGFRTKYLFAGIPFAADQIQTTKVTVTSGYFTVNGWAVYDLDASTITEGDLWGDYYHQANDRVGLFVGAALYNFKIDGEWEPTPELYGGIVFSSLFTPTLYVAHDFDLGDGTHVTFTLSHSEPLGEDGVTLDLGGNVDFNHEYYTEDSGLSYFDLSAGLSVPLGPVTVAPVFVLQRAIDSAFEGYVVDEEFFGVTASMVF